MFLLYEYIQYVIYKKFLLVKLAINSLTVQTVKPQTDRPACVKYRVATPLTVRISTTRAIVELSEAMANRQSKRFYADSFRQILLENFYSISQCIHRLPWLMGTHCQSGRSCDRQWLVEGQNIIVVVCDQWRYFGNKKSWLQQ